MEHQSRIDSFMEALTNVAIGFGINFVANVIVLPAVLHVPVNLAELGLIGVIFTVISVTRTFTLRRLFNGRSAWQAIKDRFGKPQDDPWNVVDWKSSTLAMSPRENPIVAACNARKAVRRLVD